ncbi:MAG: cell division ATP-binding protein FtsE, partial [Gammaproteobacteria bacterium]|nr:cell division ATP-binding protein FtsE [Gammaproteobacteria bacterium]
MIRMHGIAKRYPSGHDALAGINFELGNGEMAFLTGHSGAGKSTLLKLVALLERPSRGQLFVGGRDLTHLARWRVPYHRRRIGVVFQDHKLLTDRTVFDNVALPLIAAGFPHREVGRRVRAALDQVDLLARERSLPLELSSGQQQRVGIARAVVGRPPLLIADEPTGNLDPELSLEIMRLFERFNAVGVTVLVASHDHDLIARLGHRVLSLAEGRLVAPQLAT